MHGEADSWRELLSAIISNPKEKQRIADELGVQPITLQRWADEHNAPRPHNLRRLIDALPPQYREPFRDLLHAEQSLEELPFATSLDTATEISSEFYASVLTIRASSTPNLRFTSICQRILQHALEQLDPERLGLSIWVVTCMPPSGPYNQVRSLREKVGLGTPPWGGNLEQKALFLGAESLSGNVVTTFHPEVIDDLDQEHSLMPTSRVEEEKSCAIYPLLFSGRVAGVLLVSSTQYRHFRPQWRADLVEQYANLIALAFEPKDFYRTEDIALNIMPPQEEQKRFFGNFRLHVADMMITAARKGQPLNPLEAEERVWRLLESELLERASSSRDS
jgi:GAF domain-containing protein